MQSYPLSFHLLRVKWENSPCPAYAANEMTYAGILTNKLKSVKTAF